MGSGIERFNERREEIQTESVPDLDKRKLVYETNFDNRSVSHTGLFSSDIPNQARVLVPKQANAVLWYLSLDFFDKTFRFGRPDVTSLTGLSACSGR